MRYYVEDQAWRLREVFEAIVLPWAGVTTRAMFGCPAYLVNDRLFAFLVTEGVVITQVRKHDREALAANFDIAPFQAGERTIERWILVKLPHPEAFPRLVPYVKKSYATMLSPL